MATVSERQDIVHAGWLTKSPPAKRVWRPKWRRRWFTLRQSKEFPAQFFLDYYSDKNGLKLKGTINLDLCIQIDSGLRIQRRGEDFSTTKGSVFSIKTQSRIYHLQADCIGEMEKWVEVICQACGMRSTDDVKFFTRGIESSPAQFHVSNCRNSTFESSYVDASQNSNSYIPISECITGSSCDTMKQGNLYINCNSALMCERLYPAGSANQQMYKIAKYSQDSSEADRNSEIALSNAFGRSLSMSSHKNGSFVPPRPPKPSHLSVEAIHKDTFVGPRINEPTFISPKGDNQSNVYYNIRVAPAVNRNLKPKRLPCDSVGGFHDSAVGHRGSLNRLRGSPDFNLEKQKARAKLQYLDLDLPPSPGNCSTSLHSKPSPTNYKTVDFLKTEALTMTRAEACLRNTIPLK